MSKRRSFVSAAIVMAVCLVCGGHALAQGTTTGALVGTLTDSTGAVLPGVTVTISGPSLQGSRSTVTDELGVYRFRNVPPGTDYKLTAQLSGFRDSTQERIQVLLGQEGTINLVMSPGGVAESVSVTAVTPLVDVGQTA